MNRFNLGVYLALSFEFLWSTCTQTSIKTLDSYGLVFDLSGSYTFDCMNSLKGVRNLTEFIKMLCFKDFKSLVGLKWHWPFKTILREWPFKTICKIGSEMQNSEISGSHSMNYKCSCGGHVTTMTSWCIMSAVSHTSIHCTVTTFERSHTSTS